MKAADPNGPRPVAPEERDLIVKLYREGLSYAQIGRQIGRNHSTVAFIFRQEDLAEEARMVAEEEREDLIREEGSHET